MSEDDRWSDVIHQVLGALHEANVDDPYTREALAEGVRQALDSLGDGTDLNIEIMGTEMMESPMKTSRDVAVVEGGRQPDSPPTEGKKPSLRIAEPGEEEETADTTEGDAYGQPIVTQVKVLQGSPFQSISTHPNHASGWISLPKNGAPEDAWQTVYKGLRARLYRIACHPGGRIDVTVDGDQVERLSPGQSIDVEGLAIRVTTPDEGGAMGSYMPVQFEWSEE